MQGILGANCRHSYGPGDGKHNPFEKFDSEENRKAYELSQRERTLERRIRKTKREVQALQTALDNAPADCKPELQAAYQKKAALLTKQNKAYNEFCEENDLKRLSDRLSIAKWDRKQAAKARGAARKKAPEISQHQEQDVTAEYFLNSKPGTGLVMMEDGYKAGGHQNEINMAHWLHDTFGGDIQLRCEDDECNIKSADYLWNGKLWDLKEPTTTKAADDRMRSGIHQIIKNPGGVILDFKNNDFDLLEAEKIIRRRIKRHAIEAADVMILSNGKVVKVLRYKK